ncbi:GIY-YIG nuclease family protein [Aeromonas salmonicida]|uniref:GIY-YIG nuclease family protein n=1 Tax=Aeromonas salmonicida TaxID=645 RepID=UPI00232AAE85|nr:GIY-YIG nuclease family protein [Aeromonas salmonicida]WCH25942.1 GIY-YIG nuclease family protein [Aeromonas salmonicida]
MNPGYVYILINESMPNMIKVGKTRRDSRSRARELYTTGVPTPYQVAFEIFCENYDSAEESMHQELSDFRVHRNREFFRYPLDKAIILLQRLANISLEDDDAYAAIDITDELKSKYAKWIRDDIVSVRIVQPKDRVWLEITCENEVAGNLVDQVITRSDLGFISDGNHDSDVYFSPKSSPSINAEKFINGLDPFSLINTTDLFHDDGSAEVNDLYNPFKKNYTT